MPAEYREHDSRRLKLAYKSRPFQGQNPKDASALFFGRDANYSPDIEADTEFFDILMEYHNNGVEYWKSNKNDDHHPFLLDIYRNREKSDGYLYHRTFRNICLPKLLCAEQVSFVELISVPTTGKLDYKNKESTTKFNQLLLNSKEHLDDIEKSIIGHNNKLVFMTNEVVNSLLLMKNNFRLFTWINYNFIKADDMPCIYRDDASNIIVYKMLHLSSGFHRSKVEAQLPKIRNTVVDFLSNTK